MPHERGSGGGDDLASTDEVKVYKDEGDEEKRASENLSEDKLGLVIETEEGTKSSDDRRLSSDSQNRLNGIPDGPFSRRLPFGYPSIPPYPPYPGSPASLGLGGVHLPHPSFPLYPFSLYNNDLFSQPPPAHMGALASWHLGTPTGLHPTSPMYGLSSTQTPSLYGLPPPQTPPLYGLHSPHSQLPHPFYSPADFSHVPWPGTTGYPPMPFSSYSPYHQLSKFSPSGMLSSHPGISYPGISHPALVSTCQSQDNEPPTSCAFLNPHRQHNYRSTDSQSGGSSSHHLCLSSPRSPSSSKAAHIKKPLNAFMLFMKEMRQKVIDECTLKESAAINQILGRKWHSLDRAEQSKYYDMARREKELHRQMYPTWSARDNYAIHVKKKRKREFSRDDDKGTAPEDERAECPNAKKCRARFGLDQQHQWCKPCRRKKRCIRFLQDGENSAHEDDDHDEDVATGVLPVADSTTELFSPMSSTVSSQPDEPRGRTAADETFQSSASSVGAGSTMSCDDGVPVHRQSHQSHTSVSLHGGRSTVEHGGKSTSCSGMTSSSSAAVGRITSTIV